MTLLRGYDFIKIIPDIHADYPCSGNGGVARIDSGSKAGMTELT
jgi:hypothetical protein